MFKSDFYKSASPTARVTVLTLVIFLIGIWSLAFYISRMFLADMQRMVGEQQFSTVSLVAGQANKALQDRLHSLEVAASRITPEILGNSAAIQTRLEHSPVLQGLFNSGLFVTRADGVAVADVPLSAGRIGIDYSDRDTLVGPLREGKSVIGRPVIGKKLGAPIFGIAAPIRDGKGRVIGAIVGTINLGQANFMDEIVANHYGETGGYFLIAPEHRLTITATDKSRIMQPLPSVGVNVMLDRFIQGYEGYGLSSTTRGVEVVSSGKGIPVAHWVLSAAIPTEEAFAPIRDLQKRLFFAAMVVTVLAGVLTWVTLERQFSQVKLGMENEDLRRTRSELEAERERYSDLYENAPIGYCTIGENGLIERANHFAANTLGLTLKALINQNISRFICEEDKDSFDLLRRDTVKSRVPQSRDLRMVKDDGTKIWAALTAIRHKDDGGQKIRIVLSDITGRIEQEHQRLAYESGIRDALVREVHHRIKNSLQGITGTLHRFARNHPEVSLPLNQAIGQIQAISLVHAMRGKDIRGSISLCVFLASIAKEIEELWQTPVAVDFPPRWQSWTFAEDEAVPIALVLNELMVNAVKHGGREHGGVEVTLQNGARQNVVQISISNVGQLSDDRRPDGNGHSGLQLVAALMPRSGARLIRDQRGEKVVIILELEPPVILNFETQSAPLERL